jgi:hypothetical protein
VSVKTIEKAFDKLIKAVEKAAAADEAIYAALDTLGDVIEAEKGDQEESK